MGNPWEYESRTSGRGGRRRRFLKDAQSSGLHKLIRDSLISRGLDPDIIPNLSAPPSVTKPVDRDTIREVVPEPSVRSAETALQTKPRTTVVQPLQEPEHPSGGGFFKKALGKVADVAGDVISSSPVKEALYILDLTDIPRREIGKPIARALLEPLALATEAADALSPDNLSSLPRIFPTAGQIRGNTSVEILSFITDPLNALMFAGPIIKAAKAATLGARLSIKDAQLLRSAVPKARRAMVKEASGKATENVAASVVKVEGSDLLLPRGYKAIASTLKPGKDAAYVKEVGGINVSVTRHSFRAEERRILGDRGIVRPAIKDGISVDITRSRYTDKPIRELPEVLYEVYLIAKANPSLPVISYVANEGIVRLLERVGLVGQAAKGTIGKRFTFTAEQLGDVLKIPGLDLAPTGARLTGPEAARKLIGGDLPGTRTLAKEEVQALTAKVPIHESSDIKALRNKVAGEGHNPPPPPPPPPGRLDAGLVEPPSHLGACGRLHLLGFQD